MRKFFAFLIFTISLIQVSLFATDFYWEDPVTISTDNSRFPKAVSNGKETCVLWQEVDTRAHTIYISSAYYSDNNDPVVSKRFAGPIKYSGEVPDIFSAVMKANGSVYVALLTGVNDIVIYYSNYKGSTYSEVQLPKQTRPLVAPRIYETSDGSLRLFATLGENESFSLVTATSSDGINWSSFKQFEPSERKLNSFAPTLASVNNVDYVVFQSQLLTGSRISYQLYGTYSADNGETWSEPVLISDQSSLALTDTRVYTNYQNQHPFLYNFKGTLYLVWERTYYLSENADLVIAQLTENGLVPNTAELFATEGHAARARIFDYDGLLSVVWFDNRSGSERVYFSQKNGLIWEEETLSQNRQKNMFAFPVFTNNGKTLSFIWEQNIKSQYYVTMLSPDTKVSKVSLQPLSYRENHRSINQDVRIRIRFPDDSSGIAGYSYSWSQNKYSTPSYAITNLINKTNTVTLNLKADIDGVWFLKVRAFDNAGNYSDVAELDYHLDITPPEKPEIEFTNLDNYGLGSSNVISAKILPNVEDNDIAGYTYSLDYIDAIPKNLADNPRHPTKLTPEKISETVDLLYENYKYLEERGIKVPSQILTNSDSLRFTGRRNGIYLLTVAVIDDVGNISERVSKLIILNKYIPSTYIVSAKTSVNELGEITLNVTGGGFTYDGTVTTIYIDRDGESPYDLTLNLSDGHYQVTSDNSITNIKLGNSLDEGMYKIGLVHFDRGLYMSGNIIKIEHNGTIKIEPEITFTPDWKTYEDPHKYKIRINVVLLIAILVLSVLILIFACHGFVSTARETVLVRKEVLALISGDIMPSEKKKRHDALKKKGFSLKWKLVGFTAALVIAIVALVAVPLGYIMINLQEQTLSKGLEQRVEVLLEGLSSGAKAYMPLNNVLELSYLPAQADSMDEAKYATIIGAASDENRAGLNYVWATNDDNILEKIDTETVNYGVSAEIEDIILQIAKNCESLNEAASNAVGEIAANISELNAEGISLALRTDAQSVARRDEIASITTELNARLTTTLGEIAKQGMSSYPQFNPNVLDRENTDYLFYRPVLFRQGTSQTYVHGAIIVEVSTQNLIDEADNSKNTVFMIAGAVALLAVLIGAILTFILASIIVRPLKKLAAYVKVVGDTKDKAKLKGKDFKIRSKDEIGQLGEVINDMTSELARAAEEEKLSLDGKAVQNAFLPLLHGRSKIQTVAELKDASVECFGYYEGASGVSGDYFDYRRLDERWFAMIKCDASGHGVPAALIMTVVATLFREYFNSWSFSSHGTKLDVLVTKINDALESLGLKGKFAAMNICLLDTKTGDVYMCNAGDNIVHIYDSAMRKQKVLTLTETPAAGPLPSFMVEMKGGFKVEKTNLKKGDVLFLYTDGIEESTRLCRRSDFSVIQNESTDSEGKKTLEDKKELMEPERVQGVIEAVFAKSKFVLNKEDNPVSGEVLEFDFTNCEGTLEDAIMALAAVEKIFRFYKPSTVSEGDTVTVDRRIDSFLKAHFNLYDYYCANKVDDEDENYLDYTNVMEDEQLDDLTLLAVKRI